jgi:hypothetical protein
MNIESTSIPLQKSCIQKVINQRDFFSFSELTILAGRLFCQCLCGSMWPALKGQCHEFFDTDNKNSVITVGEI